MMPISAAHIEQARALVATRLAHTRLLAKLMHEVERLKARSSADNKLLNERLKFRPHPERLAGLAELVQRNPAFRRRIELAYEFLLEEMFDPYPSLEPGLPKPRPHKVDFHTLPVAARPYLLGPYLNIHPGDRFARLCLDRSRPTSGLLVILQSGGPIDADLWRGHLPEINAWLGDTWAVTAVAANTLTLIRRAELPAVIPMQRGFLRNGALFLGIATETHQPVYLPFAEMTSGTFVVGASGSGKSNATHVLMQSILANIHLFQAIFCIDGKEGMSFNRYRHAAPGKLRILTDEADVWKLTAQLVDVVKKRNATLARLGLDKAPNNLIAVVFEEMSTYTMKPSSDGKSDANKAHARFIELLAKLARQGRSAGLKIIITAQDPTVEQVPASVRGNCQTTLVFALTIDAHATAVMGELQPGRDPRKLTTGRAFVKRDTGTITTVQFPIIPAPGGHP